MKDVGAGYITEGVKRTGGQYVTLMEIEVIDGSLLHFHNSAELQITAMNGAGDSAVTYSRAPFTIDSLQSNIANELPKITVTIPALPDSIAGAYVKGQFGLRGCDVTIINIFSTHITGTVAELNYREKITLTVDTASINDTQLTFSLATPLEIFNVTVPRRKFYREFCSRRYDAGATLTWTGTVHKSSTSITKGLHHANFCCSQPNGASTAVGDVGGCPRTLDDMGGPGGATRHGCRYRGYQSLFSGFVAIPRTRIRIS